MPRIKAGQAREYQLCQGAYAEAVSELNDAIGEFNQEAEELWANEVQPKIDAVNEAIANLRQIAEEVRDELQAYFDERSENWQYGDKGTAYSEWIDQWDGLAQYDLDDIDDLHFPEVPEVEEQTIEPEEEVDFGF